jgi:hypothetical protein
MPARPVVETETIAVPITAGGAGVGDDAEADADGDAVASPARLGVTAEAAVIGCSASRCVDGCVFFCFCGLLAPCVCFNFAPGQAVLSCPVFTLCSYLM